MSDPPPDNPSLTHLDDQGRARMVDVSAKPITPRRAVAEAVVTMAPSTLKAITAGSLPKGDVFATARIAGIQAAKRTSDLIPLCHPLPVDAVEVHLDAQGDNAVRIVATCVVEARTGVEMEAITAASIAALTLYDMAKAIDRGMTVGPIRLLEKSGGRSGHWRYGGGPT